MKKYEVVDEKGITHSVSKEMQDMRIPKGKHVMLTSTEAKEHGNKVKLIEEAPVDYDKKAAAKAPVKTSATPPTDDEVNAAVAGMAPDKKPTVAVVAETLDGAKPTGAQVEAAYKLYTDSK